MVEPAIVCLDQVWSSIEEVCSTFTASDWKAATDLPGWDVKDHLSHLCGIEALLLGRRPADPIPEPWPPHVRNPLGALNEAELVLRRPRPPEDVLTEFLELTAERLKGLAETSEADLAAEVNTPIGRAPLRDFLAIRVTDCVYHEQDMRRAAGRPGALDAPPALMTFDRMCRGLPMVVAKRAAAPDGTVAAFDVAGAGRIVVESAGGRGSVVTQPVRDPDVAFACDLETFLCLVGGRWTSERAGDRIRVTGDAALARAILDHINVMI